jgi:predicted DNA-binding transcriptional regulator AlpA
MGLHAPGGAAEANTLRPRQVRSRPGPNDRRKACRNTAMDDRTDSSAQHPDVRYFDAVRRGVDQNGGLVGVQQITEEWGVSRQDVHELIARPDFPRHVGVLGSSRAWFRSEVNAWIEAR